MHQVNDIEMAYRCSSQWICLRESEILRETVIEMDTDGHFANLLQLDALSSETSHTLFYDGMITFFGKGMATVEQIKRLETSIKKEIRENPGISIETLLHQYVFNTFDLDEVLKSDCKTDLLLWQDIDFAHHRLQPSFNIRLLSGF